MSVPMRSEGSRSGVNWMRWKSPSRDSARALTAVVLARPGMPSTSRCPSLSRQISMLSMNCLLADDAGGDVVANGLEVGWGHA